MPFHVHCHFYCLCTTLQGMLCTVHVEFFILHSSNKSKDYDLESSRMVRNLHQNITTLNKGDSNRSLYLSLKCICIVALLFTTSDLEYVMKIISDYVIDEPAVRWAQKCDRVVEEILQDIIIIIIIIISPSLSLLSPLYKVFTITYLKQCF